MIVTFQRATWLKNAAPAAKIGLLNFSLSSSWERGGTAVRYPLTYPLTANWYVLPIVSNAPRTRILHCVQNDE